MSSTPDQAVLERVRPDGKPVRHSPSSWFYRSWWTLSHDVRPALLFGVILLIVVRAPALLVHPRIWAEEGIFLHFALHHSALETLFHLHAVSGYYLPSADFPAIWSAFVARKFGLEYAPFVSTYFSLCLQIVPFVILIYGKSHLFRRPTMIAGGCLIILLAPTTSGEIWLNTINSMSWTGLAAFVILFEDTTRWSQLQRVFFRSLLLLFGLCGPYAAIAFPLFAFSYFVYREKERVYQAAILFGCTLLQFGIFLLIRQAGGTVSRLSALTLDSAIVNVFYLHVTGALVGESRANWLFDHFGLIESLRKSLAVPRGGPVVLAAGFAAFVIGVILWCLWDKKLFSQTTLLIGCFLYFAAFTATAAVDGIPHSRYAFFPGLSFLLIVFLNAWEHRYTAIRVVCGAALVCALWNGARDYRLFWQKWGAGAPAWSDEVQKWRLDHNYRLRPWPSFFPPVLSWNPRAESKTAARDSH